MENYKLKMICLLCVVMTMFSNCKKSDLKEEKGLTNNHNAMASMGDGKWDVLAFGYNATGDYLNRNNLSDVAIIDMERFESDYKQRIDVGTGSMGTDSVYFGSTALDYLKELNKRKAFGLQASYGNEKPADNEDKKFFSASVNTNKEDHTISTYYSKYSYATFESIREVKRIRFNGDVSQQLLMNYLTPEFINNVATKNADYLVNRYGTHVLLDITLGGRLRFDYTAYTSNQSDYSKRVRGAKVGISGFLKKIGISFTSDVSNEEITKNFNESRGTQFTLTYFGGTNSGLSMTADQNGNFSQSFNLASWQQSVTDRNCHLINIGKAVLLSEFITDPVKKQQVNDAIQKRVDDSQKKELGEVPVYAYYSSIGADHYFGLANQPTIGDNGYFKNEGIVFYAFSRPTDGAVPVYVYYNVNSADHYYSLGNQPTTGNGNFRNEGIAFYAYPKNTPNTAPVYMYYSSRDSDHYMGTGNVPTIGNGAFVNEGPVFNVPL
jgi:hypothetical protein